MRRIFAAGLAAALLLSAPLHAQSAIAPHAAAASSVAPLPAALQPAARPDAGPAHAFDATRPRLRNHLLWGAAIGAAGGALLGAFAGAQTCLGDIDEDCGEGAPLRGALIFGALGAGVGALVYAIRS